MKQQTATTHPSPESGQPQASAKRAYRTPELKRFGSLADITQNNSPSGGVDFVGGSKTDFFDQ
jgi:hypothetical protein